MHSNSSFGSLRRVEVAQDKRPKALVESRSFNILLTMALLRPYGINWRLGVSLISSVLMREMPYVAQVEENTILSMPGLRRSQQGYRPATLLS